MLDNIQILRFAAAMAVVLHHAELVAVPAPYALQWPDAIAGLFRAGFAGVDLFFVISGVIMAESTRTLAPRAASGLRFVVTRFSRIYLGWWPFFLLYLAARLTRGTLQPEVSLTGTFLLLPLALNQLITGILWTLSFELYFYLVLGLLLFLPRPRLLQALGLWGAAVLAFTLYNMAQGLYTPARFGDVTLGHGFFGSPLVLEFIAGFFLCDYLRAAPDTRWQPFAMLALVLAAIATWYQWRGGLHPGSLAGYFHGPERVLLVGGAACGLVACALLWAQSDRPAARLLARLGDASYAIYLSHLLVLGTFYALVVEAGVSSAFRLPLYAMAISAVVVYSWVHFRCVERPLYRAAHRRIQAVFQ